jgi:hypothetical protein
MLLKEGFNTLSVTGSSKTIYYIYLILNHYLEVVFMDMVIGVGRHISTILRLSCHY